MKPVKVNRKNAAKMAKKPTKRKLKKEDEPKTIPEEVENGHDDVLPDFLEQSGSHKDDDDHDDSDSYEEFEIDDSNESGSESDSKHDFLEDSDDSKSEGNDDLPEGNEDLSEDKVPKEKIPEPPKSDKKEYTSLAKINVELNKDDEYAEDTSDDEDIRNPVGNIPMWWYDDYDHIGYDWDGKKIGKPPHSDTLDEFLKKMDDPNYWRTVKDPQTGQNIVLADEDVELIRRIMTGRCPDKNHDEFPQWIDWFSNEVEPTAFGGWDKKDTFLPNKSHMAIISKMVHALKMGHLKTLKEKEALRQKKKDRSQKLYLMWKTDNEREYDGQGIGYIPVPREPLPDHAESYNPPSEYLFNEKEQQEWDKHEEEPWKRKLSFVPQKHDCLRKVPAFKGFVEERLARCLDLHLAHRSREKRIRANLEDFLPKLPNPRDLQPFPIVIAMTYEGHKDIVRTISVDKTGQYLASGSDDGTLKIWEVNTTRCLKTVKLGGIVRSVEWCPNLSVSLLLAASDNRVLVINPYVGDQNVAQKTDEVLEVAPESDVLVSQKVKAAVRWEPEISDDDQEVGVRMCLKHFQEVHQVTWHGRGDYFATVMPRGANRSVLISQLSKRRSQFPFNRSNGLVQQVVFHPKLPMLFVATQRTVRVYDLTKQTMLKKLKPITNWISKIAVHPGGDNLLVVTYDKKVQWFDLDLSSAPYKNMRFHPGNAVRAVAFHPRYPLFATGGDDANVIVSHGMVYSDLLQNPLIVPLKKLIGHKVRGQFGVFDVKFHPFQPWMFSSGADGNIVLYNN